nr:immunoglobulin heavy chain junction region [Mus musculus]NSM04030.1 immunoglobulin heavy chain junction region [Mus musculus]NSM04036.1 immunoglobulin heavy chain junction region [Mus musculus]NSM04161.1 immunoglobulin heavy chain junction region [Mus musculus]NSM04409.1 immunoglobulin heavy chain junction region [Mus musculus]
CARWDYYGSSSAYW